MLTKKYYKLIRVSYADSDLFRITNISDQTGTLTITNGGGTLKYSLDGVNFETYDFTTHPTISVPAGGNCYMKGVKENSGSNYLQFSMDVNHSIGGNIMSIVDETNYATMTSIPDDAFRSMFENDTHIISAIDLNFGNITSVGITSLTSMFEGCTSLISTPDLSSFTTLEIQSMQSMFQGCTSLAIAPDLSGITSMDRGAMDFIFLSCTSLTVAYAPTVSPWENTSGWLSGVAASGTLYCPSQAVADLIPNNDASGCPTGWTKTIL